VCAGRSIAISGSTIVVGALYDDDGASNSGSAYVFDTNGNQLAKLTASDAAASDYFGAHQPVPPRASRHAIAPRTRLWPMSRCTPARNWWYLRMAAHARSRSWLRTPSHSARRGACLPACSCSLCAGSAVAISGSTIVVSAGGDDDNGSSSGSAYIFDTNGNQLAKLTAPDAAASDYFGAHRPVPPRALRHTIALRTRLWPIPCRTPARLWCDLRLAVHALQGAVAHAIA
jgi:tRNA(Arg) A34 adenosine deaminase TadA